MKKTGLQAYRKENSSHIGETAKKWRRFQISVTFLITGKKRAELVGHSLM